MKIFPLLVMLAVASFLEAAEIEWLLDYQADKVPAAPWHPHGSPLFSVENGVLSLKDSSALEPGYFEAEWNGGIDLRDREIVVEARVKLVGMAGHRGSPVATWPQRDGAPVCLEVSDGAHVGGILLTPPAERHPGAAPGYVRTLTDRFAQTDTQSGLHTYQLVIRGNDLSVDQNGRRILEGRDAFWSPAPSRRRTVRFGSTSAPFTGEAQWKSVRLGLREVPPLPPESQRLKITVSAPWPRETENRDIESRPYLYDVGGGLLLTSNPQGSDALREPYGVRRSTDGGKTWTLIPGLDQNVYSPQELVRLADGRILGLSRWTDPQSDGTLQATITLLDSQAETFSTHPSSISLPEEFFPNQKGEVLLFERHLWQEPDGSLTAVAWTRKNSLKLPSGRGFPERQTHLFRSTDLGRTWKHHARVGSGGEPAVARLSESEWLCIARPDAHMSNLVQHRSRDGGTTWQVERTLEEGSVMPDLVHMQNGVLACSYGRPVSGIMFSLDGGRTWRDHRVIADRVGFNYTTIREIAPGRLLFLDDAQIPGARSRIYACFIDVKRE